MTSVTIYSFFYFFIWVKILPYCFKYMTQSMLSQAYNLEKYVKYYAKFKKNNEILFNPCDNNHVFWSCSTSKQDYL